MPQRERVLSVYSGRLIVGNRHRGRAAEAVARARVNGGPVGGFREPGEARFFQHNGFGIAGGYVVEGCENAADGSVAEQGIDAGPECGEVDCFLQGMIKAIDPDGPGLGKEFEPQVHLNGGMHFQQEEDMIVLGNEIGAV